jgi:2-C-methyl-D-erythritol 4-phosphate cytidylyltransferase/2-C-methyl-D-erythritol 4-phosphate cytidylyltransferase/2-C-methyl-D-erythritol 2,4-cyclodiphosphate synthase
MMKLMTMMMTTTTIKSAADNNGSFVPVGVVITAAGSSQRMGSAGKKEYHTIDDNENPGQKITVLNAALRAFLRLKNLCAVVITIPEGGEAAARDALCESLQKAPDKIVFATGGPSRRASVFNGLIALARFRPKYVLVHDGARPFVSTPLANAVLEASRKHGAAIPVLPLNETPKVLDDGGFITSHLRRSEIFTAQTPQAFLFDGLLSAHTKAESAFYKSAREFTDDAEIWAEYNRQPVAAVPGEKSNIKLTYIEDFQQFEKPGRN